LASYVQDGDARLGDSREWSAATVSQAAAEAGTSTARVAYNPLRIFQSIAAYITANFSTVGRALATAATAAAARTTLEITATATATPAGGLSIQGGNLVMTEGIALVCSETGETVAARLNHKEKAVDRACTVIRVTWELAPTSPSTSGSSQAMLYARRSGIKTSLLTTNAALPVTTGIFTDVSGTLTGTLTLAAGETLGVDLNQVGTGASGLILTAYVRYS
jgi:hypothetical protein